MTDSIEAPRFWARAKAHLGKVDPSLRPWLRDIRLDPPRPRGSVFETVGRAIVGQQVSTQAARAIFQRLSTRCGGFTPDKVLGQGSAGLRSAGLSQRKAEYVLGLAREAPRLQAMDWAVLDDDEVREHLVSIRGVGPWTADMFLIFELLRPDVLPLGDGGIVKAMNQLYGHGQGLSRRELEAIARPWQPYRSVASWYLWRTLDGAAPPA